MTHEPTRRKRAPGRADAGLAQTLAALALVLAAGACEVPPEPYDGCPGATSPVVAPPDALVAAGDAYQARPVFPDYPCIVSAAPHCDDLGCLLPWPLSSIQVDSTTAQGTCAPDVSVVSGPALANGARGVVRWTPGRADEGQTFRLEVQTRYPEGCVQQRAAWSVTVLPGPPPPVFESLTIDRQDLRPGETVTVLAEFEGGPASWDFGPLESGVPATSPPLGASRELTFALRGGLDELAVEQRRVRVWTPPAITRFSSEVQFIEGETEVRLDWTATQATSASVDPPPLALGPGSAVVRVSGTTTFTLTVWDPVGDAATAQLTITWLPPPIIHGFAAAPAEVPVGGSTTLVASFEGAWASVEAYRARAGWVMLAGTADGSLRTGVPFAAPAQRGATRYRLMASDGPLRTVRQELTVPTTGPGSFSLLAAGGMDRPGGPLLLPLPDGRLLLLGGLPASLAEYLDLEAGRATPGSFPERITAAVALEDGRVLISEAPGLDAAGAWTWSWPAPLALVDPGLGDAISWLEPPDPAQAERLEGASLVSLGAGRALAIGRPPAATVTLVDLTAGSAGPVALLDDLPGALGPACRLADGRVLLAGGGALYDPADNAVSRLAVEATLAQRPEPTLLCLADGSALRLTEAAPVRYGGASTVQRLDPVSGTWAGFAEGPPRIGAAVELPDARVLLLDPEGGWELDLATRVTTPVGALALPRRGYDWDLALRAVRLAGGQVVVHGMGGGLPERFTP